MMMIGDTQDGRVAEAAGLSSTTETQSSQGRGPSGFDPSRGVQCEPMEPGEGGWSDWIHPLPGYLMQCCDCGLVHEMEFAITPRHVDNLALNEGEGEAGVIVFRARRYQPPCPPCDACGAEMLQTHIDTFECGDACPVSTDKVSEGEWDDRAKGACPFLRARANGDT